MGLLYMLFSKFVPIISIWELKVGEHPELAPTPQETPTKPRRCGGRSHDGHLRALRRAGGRAARGRQRCAAAASPNRDITVISSEPFEEFEFSHRDKATLAVPARGRSAALRRARHRRTLLTALTERAWPHQRRAACRSSRWWPNLVVIFELTMLGAILTTVVTLFVTAKLPSRDRRCTIRKYRTAQILVGVSRLSGATDAGGVALEQNGALVVKTAD